MAKRYLGSAAIWMVMFGLHAPAAAAAASCESLAAVSLPHTTITLANLVDAGTFVQFPAGRGGPLPAARGAVGVAGPEGGRGGQAPGGRGGRGAGPVSPFADLPAFCRVTATLTPSDDSDIKVEL